MEERPAGGEDAALPGDVDPASGCRGASVGELAFEPSVAQVFHKDGRS